VTNNNLQITNPKPVTDNAAILDAALKQSPMTKNSKMVL
tara:strand:+ start:2094 stop:2210 length:117 start_codon:yes stop_codon:yes gene_type:complete